MNPVQPIDDNLVRMGRLNAPLADELAKLPELRRPQTRGARLALDNLITLYQLAPARFDRMFGRMRRIGMPGCRHYCSPLQAFFWMVEDEKMKPAGLLLGIDVACVLDRKGRCRPRRHAAADGPAGDRHPGRQSPPDYSLQNVLDAAWNGESRLLLQPTIRKIIQGIQTDAAAEEYAMLAGRRTTRQLQGYIMDDFLTKKAIFDDDDWATIEQAVKRSRWKQFFTVADRLNAPELVSYYINKYFYFRKRPASGVYFTYYEKKAQCTDAAFFAQFMLDRAGYHTFIRSVKWDQDPWDGLHTGAGIVLDDGTYLLVANYTGINAMSGPYAGTETLDRKLSCNRNIIHSQWGAYYPPRYY